MSDFFEKLKKGMEIEEPAEKEEEEKEEKATAEEKKLKDTEDKKRKIKRAKAGRKKEKKIEIKNKLKQPSGWIKPEGELTVDVFETDKDIVIQSAIAGVEPENLDIIIENDMITIRGSRKKQFTEEVKNYFHQECYWGAFSREIVLPAETDNSRAKATIKNGILTITIPKIQKIKTKKLVVEE